MPKKATAVNAPRRFVEFVGDKNGQCVVFYKDDIRIGYKGKCTDGIPNGDGQLKWRNGFHYNGTFSNGEPCGPGVLTSPYGTTILCKSFKQLSIFCILNILVKLSHSTSTKFTFCNLLILLTDDIGPQFNANFI